MKKYLVVVWLLILIMMLAGCGNSLLSESHKASEQVEASAAANDFVLNLYADKSSYSTDETIKIWATLEYTGEKETVTIWHGVPYIAFSITDGSEFNIGGLTMLALTNTELRKGEQYYFDYVKSGSFDSTAPDAEFWENFFEEKDLKLPAGTYTVSVNGAFYLSEELCPEEKGPSCELQITVE